MKGGSAMNDDERHQLLCQLRLQRLLGALPPGAVLSAEERACVAAALEIERNLRQQCEQANNLEGGLAGADVWAGCKARPTKGRALARGVCTGQGTACPSTQSNHSRMRLLHSQRCS